MASVGHRGPYRGGITPRQMEVLRAWSPVSVEKAIGEAYQDGVQDAGTRRP